ncbi:MAG TPA: serine hydrolase domain-containing protein [Gemmatimonadaceae bacterium]|nr:serine hydrolase domain-containing protein [Gemmatimonadaceae bacterium]
MIRTISPIAAALMMAALVACDAPSDTPITPPIPVPPPMPITGTAVPSMVNVDIAVSKLMTEWHIPGGAVGVMKDGRLVYARGFGYADMEAQKEATPDALFRIASVSKPVTKAAILKLVEQGKFSLDAPAFALLPNLTPLPGATVDPLLAFITVSHLLEHTGGWDRDMSGDPMFLPLQIAAATSTPAPASAEAIVRYMMGKPLDFTPGSRFAYSNFGYAVLGRIIEHVSGKSYEQFVKETVLAPAGVTRMQLGHTLYADRLPDEVRYYDIFAAPSVFPGVSSPVPSPYGGFNLEAMDSHGGWVASVVDLLRFEKMWIAPPPQGIWGHDGALPGTYSVMMRTANGLAWVALFNARDMGGNSQFQSKAAGVLQQAIMAVTEWPAHDFFNTFQ